MKGKVLGAPALLFVLFILPFLFMVATVPTGFLLEGPGSSFDIQEDLSVSGAETYRAEGEILLTSVRLEEATLAYHIASLFMKDYDVIKIQDFLGEELDVETREVIDELDTLLSQNAATVVGLREVGVPVELNEEGALVVAVVSGYPAEGILEPGDVIVAADGQPVSNFGMLSDIINAVPAGEELELRVASIGEQVLEMRDEMESWELDSLEELGADERTVEILPIWDEELKRQVIGVSLADFFSYTSEASVEWGLEGVKGPSAGLTMTLSLINRLTPEDLTGGRKVAGTGEIGLDEEVGAIGGLPMKIEAAEKAGAEVFLYPADNQQDLEGVDTYLQLYAVEDLDQALEILESISGQ